jgi:hypothetical protein
MEAVIPAYMDLMDTQREEAFAMFRKIPEEQLWQRPLPGKWSVGEHIDHARVLTRSFRRIITGVWYIGVPFASLFRNNPYTTDIDDVYERPGFPVQVGWLWPPRYTPENPASLTTLQQTMEQEHLAVKTFFFNKDEKLLGHIRLYDPVIGWLNLIQCIRVGIYHDAHHFRIAARLL